MNQEFFKKYSIKAKKSLWQNFLIDENILWIISSTFEIKWKNILEIWPWYGALTEKLLNQKPKSLHLVELDKDMIEVIQLRITNYELKVDDVDFQIFNEDVLRFKPISEQYCLIANIPYYITSPILYRFLYDVTNNPEKMLILMQKDVGDKIIEWQIEKKWKLRSSVLSLFIAKKANVSEIIKVPASSFVPAPKVESAVLLFELHDKYREIDDKKFLEFIKIWFQEPRKKLLNNLTKWWYEKEKVLLILKELWYDENVRGEELWCDEWIGLYKKID